MLVCEMGVAGMHVCMRGRWATCQPGSMLRPNILCAWQPHPCSAGCSRLPLGAIYLALTPAR